MFQSQFGREDIFVWRRNVSEVLASAPLALGSEFKKQCLLSRS